VVNGPDPVTFAKVLNRESVYERPGREALVADYKPKGVLLPARKPVRLAERLDAAHDDALKPCPRFRLLETYQFTSLLGDALAGLL
jgi:hypothetical protein